jgi:hypothetical protein
MPSRDNAQPQPVGKTLMALGGFLLGGVWGFAGGRARRR